jgi:hypothetical protein
MNVGTSPYNNKQIRHIPTKPVQLFVDRSFLQKERNYMVVIFYLILNAIVLYVFSVFSKLKNVLHSLEKLVYWMVSSYVYQNFSAICYMNFKTLQIPNDLMLELTHFLNRIVLFPIIMVVFLHCFLLFNTFFRKTLLMLGFIFILFGLEWLADLLGIFNHINWKVWWSIAYWISALLLLIGFMKFFRWILFRKGGHT